MSFCLLFFYGRQIRPINTPNQDTFMCYNVTHVANGPLLTATLVNKFKNIRSRYE
jgi:hypothetical protein